MLLHQTYIQAKTKDKQTLITTECVLRHLQCSKPLKRQPLKIYSANQSNQISRHFTCMRGPITYWKSIRSIMRLYKHITHTQRLINNAWSEKVSCSLCFAFYYFSSFPWFIQTIWDNFYPSWTIVVALS